ncbi:hypothetical protein BGZ60DRAFT_398766 [Tricladium varicosporioides]|nr:hypothetical protein BGZ60DRAFT_398766 [Hymenoscyphus varicosporioides]
MQDEHTPPEPSSSPKLAPSPQANQFSSKDESESFQLFPNLPGEIRAKIWEAAIIPRIVRCKRVNDQNVFTSPSKSLPLLGTCQESRESAFLYGEYILISKLPTFVYFSPKIDYLWFDAGWTSLIQQPPPPIDDPRQVKPKLIESLPPDLLTLRNIMVHPNWTDERMKPAVPLTRLRHLERVLVAADEKSIGFNSKFLLGTVYDIKMDYTIAKRKDIDITTPHIAIGCLGWTGADRRRLHHGNEDSRQLVAVFEDAGAMKNHLKALRDEEWKFTHGQSTGAVPSFLLKLQRAQEATERARKMSNAPEPSSMPQTSELSIAGHNLNDFNDPQGSPHDIVSNEHLANELPTYSDVVNDDMVTG